MHFPPNPFPGSFSLNSVLIACVLHRLSIDNFPILFQISELQKDHVASAGVAIEKLFKNPDVETAELICEVRQSYESKCISYSRFILEYVAFWTYCGSYLSMAVWVHFSYFFLDLPAGEKLHDLVALLNFDVSKVVGETLGAQSVWRHQEILQEHWSSSDVALFCLGKMYNIVCLG